MNKIRTARLKRNRKILKIGAAVAITIFIVGVVGTCMSSEYVKGADPVEVISARTRTSKLYSLGGDKYAVDISIGSLHYEDEYGDWQNIETDIVPSDKPNWNYEVEKGNYHILIKDDTTIAVGKGGNWIGFRYSAFGYLDWQTKDYVILQTRQSVAPVIDGNTITWYGIFYGADLEYKYTCDKFKENLYISQDTRDYLAANPPSNYGLSNDTSYLVGVIECDWQLQTFTPEDEYGNPINWDNVNEFITSGVNWRDPVLNKIITALPLGIAYSANDYTTGDYVDLLYRFYKDGETHYLLFGAKVLDLNALEAGTIVMDPTIDEQVDADLDDAYEIESSGNTIDHATYVNHYSYTTSSLRYWGAHRWVNSDISQGDTIDVAYIEIYAATTNDDINGNWHFEYAASPAQFTIASGSYDITSRPRTSASVSDIEDHCGEDWHTSPSLVTPLQEVVDDYSPTAYVVIFRPNQNQGRFYQAVSHNNDSDYAAKLHIEYTAGGGCTPSIEVDPSSWSVNSGTPVDEDSNYTTGLTYFTITNNSGGDVTITIGGTDMAGGGYTWDLSDDGSNGDMVYGMYAGLSGGSYNIVVKEDTPYNTLVSGLADEGTQDFGLSIYTPTVFDDGNAKSGAITLTAVCD